ncbi:colicin immunity domain-containing protein [Streptomyces griseoluteus]|uniref:colicin immunity domain-containing protein n=1 Tax=Streptomyces griseoluteus TaxID=29306 RepID=UPI00142EA81E|nr:colicin immunity domain-containing protein [Streptomyces griseoluteus]
MTTRAIPADAATRPPTLLWTPDRHAALLFPVPGHVLLAGTKPFMTAAVPEGIDAARARFTRYARRQAARHPDLLAVAAAYAPTHHAWSHPAEVPPDTATAHHLHLLEEFTHGTLPAPAFAHAWWQTRRTTESNGERIRGPLEELFDRVFLLLEDYEVDPELAEPTDLTATELQAAVSEAYRNGLAGLPVAVVAVRCCTAPAVGVVSPST